MLKKSLLLIALSMVFSKVGLAENTIQYTNKPSLVMYAHSNDGKHGYQALIDEKSLVKKGSVSYFDIVARFLEPDANTQEANNKEIESEIIIPTKFYCETDIAVSYKFTYMNNQTKTIVDLPIAPETIATPITEEEKADMAILKKTVCD